MFTNFTNGAVIYNRLFPLSFIDLLQIPYKYQPLLPTKITNRANIYILSFMRLCFSAFFIAMSEFITKFA